MIPTFSFAAAGSSAPVTKNNFCSSIDSKITSTDQKLSEKEAHYQKVQSDQLSKLSSKRSDRDQKISDDRAKQDTKNAAKLEKLNAKASTDAQKQAVVQFKAALDQAVSVRRSAVDGAISTFRTALDQVITTRKTGVDGALKTFTDSISGILAKAKADCTSGMDPQTVKSSTQASIKASRDQFKSTIGGLTKINAQVKTFEATRKTSIQQADVQFKASIKQASATLKASLKSK
jgi:hypothetical protein